jgi:hypothetical protein
MDPPMFVCPCLRGRQLVCQTLFYRRILLVHWIYNFIQDRTEKKIINRVP